MMQVKTVLVTGSSTGLGNVITRALLEKDFTVFATMRDVDGKNAQQADELRRLAGAKHSRLFVLELDVTDEASVDAAVTSALGNADHIDVLINNAGIGGSGITEAFSTAQFQQTFEVNVFGIHRMLRAVLPAMRQQHSGLVMNISSTMGRLVIPFSAAYTASKYALEALTESYRYELASSGVDVVLVEPGGFASNYWSKLMTPHDQERASSYGEFAETPEKFWAGIAGMMQSEQAPHPQVVADAILQLIETPAGQRPLRTVVDPATGGAAPSTINQTTAEIQNQLLESFGLKALLSLQQG